jgi:hypothetical protein
VTVVFSAGAVGSSSAGSSAGSSSAGSSTTGASVAAGAQPTNTIARIVTIDNIHNKRTRFIFWPPILIVYDWTHVFGVHSPPGWGAQIISLVQK